MVVFGVDAHKRTLCVSGIDEVGREVCAGEFPNAPLGHRALIAWARQAAPDARRFGVECSGSFGRALTLALLDAGQVVVDVPAKLTDRERGRMRGQGKSDPRDA